ncbi:MAG: ABC transporter permease [Cyclobacteriaceae bacterium]
MKKQHTPPHLIRHFFNWWSGKAETEDLLGDLDEFFQYNVHKKGLFKAQLIYHQQVLSLLFSYALKKRKTSAAYSSFYSSGTTAMALNYFKIAIRNFSKHKMFTMINILGLAMGMSICLLALGVSVAIYQSDEFHAKKERIHQVNTYIATDAQDKTYGGTFNALGNYMSEQYPFVEQVVNINSNFRPVFQHHGNQMAYHGYYADGSFFEVFDFELILGNPKTVLDNPYSLVLTEKIAETLFKDENPLGKVLETEHGNYTITGVMKDLKQTHFYFEVLTSYSTLVSISPDLRNDWKNLHQNYVYLLLNEGTTDNILLSALEQTSTHAAPFNPDLTVELSAVRLDDVVPRWNISQAIGIGWDQPSMLFFLSIGVLILLPAVFNYTNLSIARALKRAKEIGIRKVVGADKGQIKNQFLVETILLTLISLIGALFIFVPLRQEFLNMVVAAEVLDTSLNFDLIVTFLLFTLLVGLFAGAFPAAFFSRMNPVQILKGNRGAGSGNVSGIKKGLFVFQFFMSLVFVIGVLAIGRQYAFVFNTNHGFTSDNVLTVPFKGIDKQIAINELNAHPDVKSVTASSSLPGILIPQQVDLTPNELDTLDAGQVFIANDFIKNFDIQLTWGESQSLTASTQNIESVLVNEQFMKAIKVFNTKSDSLTFTLTDGTHCRIVGITEDFNFEPLSEHVKPIVFRQSLEKSHYALLTINSNDIKSTIQELEKIWTGIDQEEKFESSFLNDEIEDAYYFLMAQLKIFSYLSTFAITISCLGLLGMVSFTTENRTKEIAIRKIMGASNPTLYYLLTKDFLKLILISAMIAIPFSYVFYDKLFLFFLIPNGTGLGVLEVLAGVLFLFLVGFISIFWQTSKVANENPANNLRYE